MNIYKNINCRIILFSLLFIINIPIIWLSGSYFIFSDFKIMRYLSSFAIIVYSILQLITCIVYKTQKSNNIYILNVITSVSCIISMIPIGIFLFVSEYINKFFLVGYILFLFLILFSIFCKSEKINQILCIFFFIPVIILITLSGNMNYRTTQKNCEIAPCIKIEELNPNIKKEQIKTDVETIGTIGSVLEQTIYFNSDGQFTYCYYKQFSVKNDFLKNRIKEKYMFDNVLEKSNNNITLYYNDSSYFIEFEKSIIIIDTNVKLDSDLLFNQLNKVIN